MVPSINHFVLFFFSCYEDVNNLYGLALSRPLPYKDYKWLTDEEIAALDIPNLSSDADTGYIFNVTLSYPKELHEAHEDFPYAPHKMTIDETLLSPYANECHKKLKNTTKFRSEKLVASFADRKEYVVHYTALKLYLSRGLKLEKIHSAMSFTQGAILKPFIDSVTLKRKNATSRFEKDLHKKSINSTYGKLLESTKDRLKVFLVRSNRRAEKLVSSPFFHSFKIINEDFVAIFHNEPEQNLGRPIIAGYSVLERSKVVMSELYHDIIVPQVDEGKLPGAPSRISLLAGDTDSLFLKVDGMARHEFVRRISNCLDTSNFPKSAPFYSTERQSIYGYSKLETSLSNKIIYYTGIRAKVYALIIVPDENYAVPGQAVMRSKVKGITKTAKMKIPFERFLGVLRRIEQVPATMRTIRSYNHRLYTVDLTKTSFGSFDDKRFILKNSQNFGLCSVPHYSKRIIEGSGMCHHIPECLLPDMPLYNL